MAPTWLSILHTTLELLSFVSGPVLVVVAILALKQISIAKGDVQVRSRREAASLATTQCQRYYSEIIPLLNELDELINQKEIPEYRGEIADFCQDDILKNPTWAIKWLSKTDDLLKLWIQVLNSLESFAIYFTTGVADEEIAFSTIGLSYCNTVKKLYAFIATGRIKGKNKHFEHIVTLYKLWSSRLEKYNLEDQLDEMQSKIKSIKVKTIKPIGTDF
jgi:hypothetical protein